MGPIWLGFAAVQIPRPWDYLCLIEARADLLFAMKTARPRWEPSLVLSPSCLPRVNPKMSAFGSSPPEPHQVPAQP